MTEQDMEDCSNCGPSTREDLGMIPHATIQPIHEGDIGEQAWVHAYMCLSCGDITIKSITQEDLEEAVDQIIDLYEEYELAPQEEIDQLRV